MSDADSLDDAQRLTTESRLRELIDYDERMRTEHTSSHEDEALQASAPELTKAIRALRDILKSSTESDSLATSIDALPTESGEGISNSLLSELGIADRFRLIAELGSGGFGIVYQAYDTWLKRQVAIKFLRPELVSSPALRQRFLRESRAAARLNHPYIVRVLEVSESAGSIWQVCELVEGAPLSSHMAVSSFSPHLAARFTRDLVDAVAHAHASNVLHRDIKPSNILVDCQAGHALDSATLRLTDFGLARLTDIDATLLSHTGMLVGTPRYMAPEQLTGKIDQHGTGTDIYAIGILLYELLSGKNPFGDVSSLQERLAKVDDPVMYVRKLSPRVPRDLATICHKCLENRPERRYLSAVNLRDDLDRFLRGDPTHARPLPFYEHLWRWSLQHRTSASILGMFIIMIAMILTQTLFNNAAYRQQNSQLTRVNSQLATQEYHSRELARTADELREAAISNQKRYVELAWRKGIREAYAAWSKYNFAEASELLVSLAESHPESASGIEWRLLRADIDKQVQLLLDLPCAIHEVRAIPNSERVAAAAADGNVYIVDVTTGTVIGCIKTGIRALHALAVSPDGRTLATGGTTDPATDLACPRLYDLQTLQRIKQLPGESTTIESLEFSRDGQQLACGSRYMPVKIHQLESGSFTELPSQRRNVWLSASPATNSIAAQGTTKSLLITDPEKLDKHQQVDLDFEVIYACRLPTGAMLLASHPSRGTTISTSDNPPRYLSLGSVSAKAEVTSMTATHDLVAASLLSGEVLLWPNLLETASDSVSPQRVWQLSKSPIHSVAIVGKWIVSASHDGELIRTLSPEIELHPEAQLLPQRDVESSDGQFAQSLAWEADGQHILVGMVNGAVTRLAVENGPSVNSVNDSKLNNLKLTDLKEDEIWSRRQYSLDASSQQPSLFPARPKGQHEPFDRVFCTTIAPQKGRWAYGRPSLIEVIGSSPEATVRPILFRVAPPKSRLGNATLAFAPDASKFAWSADSMVHVIALSGDDQQVSSSKLKGHGVCLDWSPSGERVALSGEQPIFEFAPARAELTEIIDYGIHTMCLAYNSRGQIISGHRDGTIRFVDPVTRRSHVLQVHPAEVCSLLFIDGGRIGLSLDAQTNIGIWHADGESIGLIHHDPLHEYDPVGLAARAWTDTDNVLKVAHNNRDGHLLIDTWNLRVSVQR